MKRTDEERQVSHAHHAGKGGSLGGYDEEHPSGKEPPRSSARSPLGGVSEHESHEHDSHEGAARTGGEGAGMARSPSAAKAAESAHMGEGEHEGNRTVKSGPRSIARHHVEADHAMGDGEGVNAASAEGFADAASSKANRKEADEPEREENEKAAVGREPHVPTKNTMGHGERETIARHTI